MNLTWNLTIDNIKNTKLYFLAMSCTVLVTLVQPWVPSRGIRHSNHDSTKSNHTRTKAHHMALFGLPYIRFVRLLFSAGTVFFSHNNSVRTVFFSQVSDQRTGLLRMLHVAINSTSFNLASFQVKILHSMHHAHSYSYMELDDNPHVKAGIL